MGSKRRFAFGCNLSSYASTPRRVQSHCKFEPIDKYHCMKLPVNQQWPARTGSPPANHCAGHVVGPLPFLGCVSCLGCFQLRVRGCAAQVSARHGTHSCPCHMCVSPLWLGCCCVMVPAACIVKGNMRYRSTNNFLNCCNLAAMRWVSPAMPDPACNCLIAVSDMLRRPFEQNAQHLSGAI